MQDCSTYYGDANQTGVCGQCVENTGCIAPTGFCNLKACQTQCGTGSAACPCIASCLQTQSQGGGANQCCALNTDAFFQCVATNCSSQGQCPAGG
jgi:hypothetical protein